MRRPERGDPMMIAAPSARRSTRQAVTRQKTWYKVNAGDYVMTAWSGESQVTYRVTLTGDGWITTRRVAGAAVARLDVVNTTLRDAQASAESDVLQGF